MLDVYKKFFGNELARLEPELVKLMPALGKSLNKDPKLAKKILANTAKTLRLSA
jgi:hypothetical protein